MSVSLNTENTQVDEETLSDSLPKMGEILQQKREEKNLTVEDISSRLRLSVRQINALEANNFAMFPEPMMTRGFIRNYARFLDIDPEVLLSAYRVHVPNDAPPSLSIHSANVMLPSGNKRSLRKYVLVLLFLAIAGAGWLIYSQYIPWQKLQTNQAKPPETAATETAINQGGTVTEQSESMPEAALPIAEREAQQTAEATPEQASIEPSASQNPDQATNTAVKAALAAPLTEVTPQSIVKIKQDASVPLLKLQFSFAEQSWVSVTDQNGNQLLNKTKAAGSKDQVEAKPPLKVVIGNAAGSQLFYQGKSVDLVPYTRMNVARLTLELE